jgi:hypothetical protein
VFSKMLPTEGAAGCDNDAAAFAESASRLEDVDV